MPLKTSFKQLICVGLLPLVLVGCFKPPFNDFKRDMRPFGPSAISPITMRAALIKKLNREGIQFVKYGDQNTLVIPTDKFYVFNSPHLDDICYPGLNDSVELIKTYHYGKIYVAAFTDDVGTEKHKDKLSTARAETMLTFLWANNIAAEKLLAEGYGDKHAIGDNHYIHSSAYNRRIEIQWSAEAPRQISAKKAAKKIPASMMTK
jgi:outer membrane protein OmpA-like peptidoglycan-associated protein